MGQVHIAVVVLLVCLHISGVPAMMNFTCRRPTTPCDTWHGMCQPDGQCACSNSAFGQRCEVPGSAIRDGGNCVIYNPCTAGTCYDDGVVAKCDCPEGVYGEYCQHPMVFVDCDGGSMVMNIFPYGYDLDLWTLSPPLTGHNLTCQLSDVDAFVATNPSYSARKWQGFAGAFAHKADSCAGDAILVSETSTAITYSRTIYVSYNADGPDPTDQTLEVTCGVTKVKPTPPPVRLPRAKVTVSFRDPRGRQVQGPMRLGSTVHVVFQLNIPNHEQFDDVQMETCWLKDLVTSRNAVIVDRACAVGPVGQLVFKRGPGVAVLIMGVRKVPGMSTSLSFQCRVRVCKRNIDDYCSTPANCHMRGRRSVDHVISDGARDPNIVMVESAIEF